MSLTLLCPSPLLHWLTTTRRRLTGQRTPLELGTTIDIKLRPHSLHVIIPQ